MLFYINCLVDACENKESWRNAKKGMEVIDKHRQELGPQYLKELTTARRLRLALYQFRERASYLSLFDHAALV
jgi:hypothetical protein